jgi:hypothetical protein
MSDLPKRLRYEATWFEGEDMHDLLRESADALERVERALNEARKALVWAADNSRPADGTTWAVSEAPRWVKAAIHAARLSGAARAAAKEEPTP